MSKFAKLSVFVLAALFSLPASARDEPVTEGVNVGKTSSLTKLVPAEQVEAESAKQYQQMLRQAAQQKALAPDEHPQVRRLRAIAQKILPFTTKWNPRAEKWKWEVNLIGSKQINAFCMPGGKIAFYSGILETLKMTDDEVAMVMGHEIAHALREHARERMGAQKVTQGALVIGSLLTGGKYDGLANIGGQLLTLKFSRGNETDADTVGLELAARAGYDPRAGITLWRKMQAANKGAPPQWLSTHPASDTRIKEIEKHLPEVMPLYYRASGKNP